MERKAVKIYTAPDNLQAGDDSGGSGKKWDSGLQAGSGRCGDHEPGTAGNSTFGEEIFVAEEDVPKAAELLEGMGLEAERKAPSGD